MKKIKTTEEAAIYHSGYEAALSAIGHRKWAIETAQRSVTYPQTAEELTTYADKLHKFITASSSAKQKGARQCR